MSCSVNNGIQKEKIEEELVKVKTCLKSIIIIPEEDRENVLEKARYHKFMASLAAVNDLIFRAYENNSFIELVALLANKIDALLRLSLILKEQIDNDNDAINTKLIYQGEKDKAIHERTVYNEAKEKGIIDEKLFERLNNQYNQRNKVIHRYIISDILTKDIMKIVNEYILLEEKINEIEMEIEKQQFDLKKGILGSQGNHLSVDNKSDLERVIAMIGDKHANRDFSKKIFYKNLKKSEK